MSTPVSRLKPTAAVHRPLRLSPARIVLLGVIVIPVALSAALNSYGPLTEDGAIRMAFATVAGQTIAILSAIAALALTIIRRPKLAPVAIFAMIAAAVTLIAVGTMMSAGEVMLERLDLVAQVNVLNR